MAAHIRNSEKTRQDILLAAEQNFSDKGFYGARIDEIAADAKINKRMIYEYFGSKEALYKKVLFRVYKRLENAENELIDRDLHGVALIRALICMYFDFLRDNESFVQILMWENLNKAHSLNEMPDADVERPTIRYFTEELRHGKEIGVFRPELDEEQTVVSLITICFANFSNRYTLSKLFRIPLYEKEIIEQRKQHTIELVLTYLCRDPQSAHS